MNWHDRERRMNEGLPLRDRITWDRCACCGGNLPLVDGDNDSPDLPHSRTKGTCPGYVTDGGRCGCYSDDAIREWLRDADAEAAAADAADDARPPDCACGEFWTVRCEMHEPATVTVEYMPVHLRASHEEAHNRGTYPANGARRIRVTRRCADAMLESDPDWVREV